MFSGLILIERSNLSPKSYQLVLTPDFGLEQSYRPSPVPHMPPQEITGKELYFK